MARFKQKHPFLAIKHERREQINKLTPEQLGKLILALLDYDMYGKEADFSQNPRLDVMYDMLKADAAYNRDKRELDSLVGSLGGLKSAHRENRELTKEIDTRLEWLKEYGDVKRYKELFGDRDIGLSEEVKSSEVIVESAQGDSTPLKGTQGGSTTLNHPQGGSRVLKGTQGCQPKDNTIQDNTRQYKYNAFPSQALSQVNGNANTKQDKMQSAGFCKIVPNRCDSLPGYALDAPGEVATVPSIRDELEAVLWGMKVPNIPRYLNDIFYDAKGKDFRAVREDGRSYTSLEEYLKDFIRDIDEEKEKKKDEE